ncbi:MAG: carbohydrate kinase family protein [Treponema sp.]|nr:carbohydrate kinase family protein [Treponema sp.]
MNKKVYCIGAMACDVPLRPVPKDIFEHDHLRIERPVWSTGGDATNAAVALIRLGASASLTGIIGRDPYGDFMAKSLEEAGVDMRGVIRHQTLGTVVSHILIEPSGERHFVVSNPVKEELGPEHINMELLEECDLVYIGSSINFRKLDENGSAGLFKKAHELGKFTATDFHGDDDDRGGYWLKKLEPMLRETDICLPSIREAKYLTGKKEIPAIRDAFAPLGIKILAIKLGGEGCYVTDFKNEWKIPAFTEFTPVDTTGAGDSFGAGFVRGILTGWNPEACGLFACAVAGFNITKKGAVAGVPDFQTAYRFVTEHCGAARFPVND